MPKDTYTFGDSDRAAERLYWLAHTFDPHTVPFARESTSGAPSLCVDLGAGPGFLTRSLHAALGSEQTVGLEASERFLEFGRKDLPEGVTLRRHDITEPLPVSGDLLVSRFLLTHLRDPEGALRTWRASMASGATLLLEELAEMDADLSTLRRYYGLVALVQQAAGQDMNVGRRLSDFAQAVGFGIASYEVAQLEISIRQMARLHALNLPTLRSQAVVGESYSAAELTDLQTELEALAGGESPGVVRVHMARCVAFR